MLARAERLRLGRDIDRVFRSGRYGGGGVLSAKVLQVSGTQSRAVVIVGKKVSKSAVVRNRNRRRLIELLASLWGQILPGCDIVITVHSDAQDMKADELKRELTTALERAGAIKRTTNV